MRAGCTLSGWISAMLWTLTPWSCKRFLIWLDSAKIVTAKQKTKTLVRTNVLLFLADYFYCHLSTSQLKRHEVLTSFLIYEIKKDFKKASDFGSLLSEQVLLFLPALDHRVIRVGRLLTRSVLQPHGQSRVSSKVRPRSLGPYQFLLISFTTMTLHHAVSCGR